ncbi:MAG: phosphoribosylglycinamide synthetase C domain-containing protein, partial [Bacteroidales bacterium]|nr:phosphoribosylglycinamide synthetase C domain-containing protein [Bacteroidales bacterium]
LPEAKDYKRVNDGDSGPNTGGMGAVSPVPFAGAAFMEKVEKRIIMPTVGGLRSEGIPYRGFIFFGLINCKGEPYVIEYNVRMGDPETEAVLPRIKSDLLSHLIAAAEGRLANEQIEITKATSVTGVATSGGYPGNYQKGFVIEGLDSLEDAIVFHSGTKVSDDGRIITSGGRVLAVTVLGTGLEDAAGRLYKSLSLINYDNIYYRRDLGKDLVKYL